ncbi:hypothetical protein DPV78_007360 [Talaromyces pinophilus]|nr:hypothetical protein DPV78_007360 [Talaromyces pinophilus]
MSGFDAISSQSYALNRQVRYEAFMSTNLRITHPRWRVESGNNMLLFCATFSHWRGYEVRRCISIYRRPLLARARQGC